LISLYFYTLTQPTFQVMRRQPTIFLLLCFTLLCAATSPEPHPTANFRPGKDHAILFAVNTYKAPLVNLSNPITNARQIAEELESRFGFKPHVLENPTSVQIEETLRDYYNRFEKNLNGEYPSSGQLFIFFSGHGTEQFENGFFLPADADMENLRQTGLLYSYLRPLINAINCQHILVAVDACYSVTFDEDYKKKNDFVFRRPGELSENDKILVNHDQYKARVFFTSDAVGDMTPDKSGFAKKLLEGLRTFSVPSAFMTSSQLFANYVQKASPTPHGGEFGDDEAASTFLFFSAQLKPKLDTLDDVQAWNDAKTSNTLEAYRAYLHNFPQGEFRESAEQEIKAFEQKNLDYNAWQLAKQLNTNATYEKYLRENPEGDYRLLPVVRDNLVFIPAGSFQMGSNDGERDEKPAHTVIISSFYLSKYEVTVEEFKQFIDATKYQTDADKDGGSFFWNEKVWEKGSSINWKYDAEGKLRPVTDYKHPVIHVSWNDATAYCQWLSKKTGLTYRLPTEAEWEYAARGGRSSNYTYAGSNDIDELAWYDSNAGGKTHPVGQKKANALGLYDMSGNATEWCQDWYDENYYAQSSSSNPKGPNTGSFRVTRGASWSDDPAAVRVAHRYGSKPGYRECIRGFRIARQL
jgi:formylglycine-generating enzyme